MRVTVQVIARRSVIPDQTVQAQAIVKVRVYQQVTVEVRQQA
ncbi:hypothetical protein [Enterococcus sp. HMSC066C04]|nr:hypothetical protein [Enterococcus sp. HMSC066C04]